MKTVTKIFPLLLLITVVVFSTVACEAADPYDEADYVDAPGIAPPDLGYVPSQPEVATPPGGIPGGTLPPSNIISGSQEEGMENALITFRNLLPLDDEVFTDFSYSSTYSNWEAREGLIWHFHWSGENASTSASIMPDGTLLDFNSHRSDAAPFGFALVSMDDAIAVAKDFVARANPRTKDFFREPLSIRTTLHSSNISITFNAQVGDFRFPASQIIVGIDKNTGEISSYSTRNIDPSRFIFEAVSSLISEDAAVESFAQEIGLTLEYMSTFCSETDSIRIFPVYTFNYVGQRYVSALTGEVVDFVFDMGLQHAHYGFDEIAFAAFEADVAAHGVRLSPAELAAIEQVAGFLTSEQARYRLFETLQLSELSNEDFNDVHISLERDWSDRERFVYNIRLWRHLDWDEPADMISGISGTVDAATGRVRSFHINYNGMPSADPNNMMTEAQVLTAVNEFLEEMAPDEFARTRLHDDGLGIMPLDWEWVASGVLRFNRIRVESNALFRQNGITVTFNAVTGRVTNFSLNWLDNVTFPSISGVLSPQAALAAFVRENGSETIFITTGEGNARLVFDFGSSLIDPFSGEVVGFDGMARENSELAPDYSDVIGHPSERYVMRLLENGVYNWSGRFFPDMVMNEVEFVQYIMQIEQPWIARMNPEQFLERQNITLDVSADRETSRQFASRAIVEFMGFGQIAQHHEWFLYPFNDNVSDEFRGFITIAYMLDIVSGDAARNFNATDSVTRGSAAQMLHNLVLARMEG